MQALGIGIGLQFSVNTARAPTGWWDLDGTITAPTAAYQSIGAASFAASLVNLANPGTYDLTVGNAPAWASGTGWTFDGINDYLDTGIVPPNNQNTWSMIVRFSGGTLINRAFAGYADAGHIGFQIWHIGGAGSKFLFSNGTLIYSAATSTATGVVAIAGAASYVNGVAIDALPVGDSTATSLYIGARNLLGSSNTQYDGAIPAIAIYPYTLTAPQVAALTTRMGALT